jgi:putative selenate reductase molybdopterin-binding subunit
MQTQIITLRVNGHDHDVAVKPNETLLSVLRDRLALTGTKEGCGEGQCGTCTVLLGQRAAASCILLAVEATGQEITTIEGLAVGGKLHPLQEAFVQQGAVQCGFCTPGMILSAKALLDASPDASEDEIRRMLEGNLCRCTGYGQIVDAIRVAAQAMRSGKPLRGETRQPAGSTRATIIGRSAEIKEAHLVGQPAERVEARAKTTGKALYGADPTMPGMAYGKILRSPHPHARILSIDTSKAEALPGVLAVASAADTPGTRFGMVIHDETVFALGKVRYRKQPVAAVAALDLDTAEQALSLIEVKYEPLPPVFDMEEALKPGAPLVHEDTSDYGAGPAGTECPGKGNMLFRRELTGGDVEKGFRESDLVLEERYVTAHMHQGYLEPHACLASFDSSGRLTVWTPTQGHFFVRSGLAALLDMPMSDVKVVPAEIGGAFGGKFAPFLEAIAAVLAKKSGRPVRMVLSRQEDLEDARPRSATVTEVKTGVKKDGTLLARQVRFIADSGAFADWTPGTASGACAAARGPYRIPNYHLEAYGVYTNKFITGPMRAPGYPQLTFALESHMDEIADRLGLDPFEFRMKNALAAGDLTFVGNRLKTPILLNMLAKLKEVIDSDPEKDVPDTGWGIGCGEWEIGGGQSGASLKLNEDGTISLIIGSTDLTGSRTSLAQVAADELSVGLENLSVTIGDTDTALLAPGSGGSMVTYNMSNAVRLAAEDLARQVSSRGAKALGVGEGEVELSEGKVILKGNPSQAVAFSDLAGPQIEAACACEPIPPAHTLAVQGVKVRVDPDTGQVHVLRAVGLQDCGTAINPQSVEAQVSGGMAQALGNALWEQIVFKEGEVMNDGLTEYTMPTARDLPHFEAYLFEGEFGSGRGHGSKGIGEPVHIPTPAAVANAIRRAVGVRLREMPMTPERIWRAMREQRGNR